MVATVQGIVPRKSSASKNYSTSFYVVSLIQMKYPNILNLEVGDHITLKKKIYEVMKCGSDCLYIVDENDLKPIDYTELREITKSTEKQTLDLRYYKKTKEYMLFKIVEDVAGKRSFTFISKIEKKAIKLSKKLSK